MKSISLVLRYSSRLLFREWRRYVLPLLSLFLTALVVSSTWLLTSSSGIFLQDKQKEFLGGDVTLESSFPIHKEEIEGILHSASGVASFEQSFFATTQHGTSSAATSMRVVDNMFPLYGSFLMSDGEYRVPKKDEILIDENLAKKLQVKKGEVMLFNNKMYTVIGVWKREPDSLSTASFFPKALISSEGFTYSDVDASLLRGEYDIRIKIIDNKEVVQEALIAYGKENGIRVRVLGTSASRFEIGLDTVSTFLIVAVLLSCILAAVNIYASTLYLLTLLRKSFATLLALGFTRLKLTITLFFSLSYVVIVASVLGFLVSLLIFSFTQDQVTSGYAVTLPEPKFIEAFLITLLLSFATTLASYVPSIRNTLKVSPRALLLGVEEEREEKVLLHGSIITVTTLLPLIVVASFLLSDVVQGTLVVVSIVFLYIVLASSFLFLLRLLYSKREKFSFFIKTIITEKKADGFFGLISFTSLFIALVALTTLTLLQASIASFLANDLGRTVPATYVIDVQKSQKEQLQENFPDLVLFPNVGARIISIDDVQIQEALARGDETVSRELGREYNLTYRKNLLESESIVEGKKEIGALGEISIEKEFAQRAQAKLGSRFVFSIQGFRVTGVVTSVRETESRSGMPFFFIVMSPEDIERFPTTFFGYSNQKGEYQTRLGLFLATNMPTVSMINTEEISALAQSITNILLLLVFIITLPPLVLATLLIATLVISSYKVRKRDGARLLVLGATRGFVERLYVLESLSTTLISSLFAYSVGVFATYIIAAHYIKLPTAKVFDKELVFILVALLVSIMVIAVSLSRGDKRKIREILIHEENQ
ncbi:MAG: putative transport system permease protein [Patescibacteria group bacterium]|nr:putative transport system permease protein [Patescibacteria group bacterium]